MDRTRSARGGPPRGVDRIAADLRALGLRTGDAVMVHASLRAIGPVERGADGVLDALAAAVGPAGTILMVLGARDDWAWVHDLPEEQRVARLADAVPFDAAATPADPEVGALAEVFRARPGTLVSDHPEGRFAAAGARARAWLDEVPWDDYFGPGSPLARLLEADGRVLRLGADRDTVTLLHHCEYLARLPRKRRVRRHRRVASPTGPRIVTVECLDDATGIVDYPGDYFADLLDAYLATGAASVGRVGGADGELIEARSLVAFGVEWMEAHLADPPAG